MLAYNAWHKLGQKFALYYYEVSDGEDTLQFSPNRYVDISETEPTKKRHVAQCRPDSPTVITHCRMTSPASGSGIEAGCKRPEAFLFQLQSPYDIFPLAETYAFKAQSDRPT